MKQTMAIILIALGALVMAYSGITYTTRGKPVNVLGITFETTDSHFIPPVAGALAVTGGIVLLLVNAKKAG